MNIEKPPRLTERSISCESHAGTQLALRVMQLSLDHHTSLDETPVKPSRSGCWNVEVMDCSLEASETDNTTVPSPLSQQDDESSVDDGHTVVSDITNPTTFDSSFSNPIDCSWRQDSLDTSLRVITLGSLQEEENDSISLEILRSSSKDRAVFETDGNDSPPQQAPRPRSTSFEDYWTWDSVSIMECRFEKIAPADQDKPMTLPRASYSLQLSVPPPSALPKLAEVFRSGCTTGTHIKRLKKYPNTFVGSEAVDFMLSANLASTREDAVFLGRRFCKELNLFRHVYFDHVFKDGQYFYRFNDTSVTPITRKDLIWMSEQFVEGMPVLKHMRRRFKTYANTFLGEEAVNYMVHSNLASTRLDAVLLGQRMMEELDIFEPVAHQSRFKDSCHLYRFVTRSTGGITDVASSQAFAKIESLMDTIIQHTQPTPPPSTGLAQDSKENSRVSFGLTQTRCFERCLDCNPATNSGPSLGLGWEFYDDSPVLFCDESSSDCLECCSRLSVQDRISILRAWGYSKRDISKATRVNKIIRKQRKRSLNLEPTEGGTLVA